MATYIDINKEYRKKITIDRAGDYVLFMHNYSGKVIVECATSNINVDIFGLYIGKTSDKFKVDTVQLHTAPNSVSNLFIKGVFDDNSKFDYEGLIRIEKTGQQCHAYQKNKNLILSDATYIESKPFLEILANDVFCTHGSTTGKLNEEELFYTKSRGLNSEDAQKLLVDGFIYEIEDIIKQKIPEFSLLI